MWYSFCPNKSAAGVICNKPVNPKQHHCYGCRFGGGVDRRHAALARCFADIIQSHSGVSTDRLNTLGWILSVTLTVQSRIWMSLLLLLSLAVRPWSLLPAQNQDPWPRERRRTNSTGTHTSTSFLSSLRPQIGLAHMPGNSLTTHCVTLITHH